MCDSGCEGLLIGLENLSQQTMTATGKNCNQVSEYRRQIRRLRDNRIAALGCFVLGFDEDTPESIRDTIRQIRLSGWIWCVFCPHPAAGTTVAADGGKRPLNHTGSEPV